MIDSTAALLPSLAALGTNASPILNKRDNFAVAIGRDFASLGIILDTDGNYYAYASTDVNGHKVQVATSEDGSNWTYQEGVNARPTKQVGPIPHNHSSRPRTSGLVTTAHTGCITAKRASDGLYCLRFAVGSDPMEFAPLVALYDEPWACDDEVGLIDPAMFQDQDGRRWVMYKIEREQ